MLYLPVIREKWCKCKCVCPSVFLRLGGTMICTDCICSRGHLSVTQKQCLPSITTHTMCCSNRNDGSAPTTAVTARTVVSGIRSAEAEEAALLLSVCFLAFSLLSHDHPHYHHQHNHSHGHSVTAICHLNYQFILSLIMIISSQSGRHGRLEDVNQLSFMSLAL